MILELIHKTEGQKKIEEAANLYEEWLNGHPDDTSSIINLAVLYWYVTDYGVHSGHGLPLSFVEKASHRSRELLDENIANVDDPEAIFWRMYFDYADWDRDIAADVEQLIKKYPNCLVPHFLLVMNGSESLQSEAVSRLRESQSNVETVKAQYIRSVLDSCLANRSLFPPGIMQSSLNLFNN